MRQLWKVGCPVRGGTKIVDVGKGSIVGHKHYARGDCMSGNLHIHILEGSAA
jgi:hypothetical protein